MKFEDIESAWGLQQAVAPAPVDLAALQRSLRAQISRRRRTLLTAGICALLGLIVMQALFFLNLRTAAVESTGVALARLLLHQTISLVLVVEVIRAYLRHRRLATARAATVREVVNLSLAGVEGEMTDYRIGRWVLLVLALHSLLSVYLNRPNYGGDWSDFTYRAVIIAVVYGLLGWLGWRHYRRVLQPRRDELRARQAELQDIA